MLWFILVISFSLASSYILCRRFALSSQTQTKALTALLIFALLYLLPVHLAATLELFGIFHAVSLPHVVSVQALIFFFLIAIRPRSLLANKQAVTYPQFFQPFAESPRYIQASAIVLFVTMGIFALNLITGYPKGYDALTYHFLVAVRWFQEGSLRFPPTLDWGYCLPGNAHIGMMILMSSGFQSLTTVTNIIACCISGCATYLIAFKLSGHRPAALLSTIVFLSIPIVQFQTFTGYVDLYGAAFILAGIALFLYRLAPPKPSNENRWYAISVFLSGCAWGIAVGTKQIYFVYAFACLTGATITVLFEHKTRHQRALLLLILMALGVSIPCYFWFLRAFQATGNPFFPVSVKFSQSMLPSVSRPEWMMPKGYADSKYVRSIFEWFVYPWVEYMRGATYYHYSPGSGFGAAFAATATVGTIFSAFFAVKNRQKKMAQLQLVLLFTLLVMLLLWWFALDRVPRFAIPALGFACALTAPVFAKLISSNMLIFKVLILSSISLTCAILIELPLYQLHSRLQSGFWKRNSEYHYPPLIDRLPKGSVIWNRGNQLNNFPLAGRYLSNKVIPKCWIGSLTTQEFLQKEKIDYIAISGEDLCDDCNTYGTLIYNDKNIKIPQKRYQISRIWKVDKERLYPGFSTISSETKFNCY